MAYIGNIPAKGENNSFKLLDNIKTYTETFDGSSSSVINNSADSINVNNHRFVQGQRVVYSANGGTVITGLSDNGVYYIIKEDQNTFKLATTAARADSGTVVAIAPAGSTTTHKLTVGFDAINTKFLASYDGGTKAEITRSAQLNISINGVVQEPQDTKTPTAGFGHDVGSVIVFSTAPDGNDSFWGNLVANNFPTFDQSDNKIDNFTGDNTTTDFTLSKTPPDNRNILVTLDGVTQHPSDGSTTRAYTLAENVLSFTSAPASLVSIQVRHIGFAGASAGGGGGGGVTSVYGRTGAVVLKPTDNPTVGNVSAGGWLSVGSTATFDNNVTIKGVLTYDDVTIVDAIGFSTFREGLRVKDNKSILFGDLAAGDFEIKHDTNNTVLQNTTGALYLKGIGGSGNNIIIEAKNNASSARFLPDAQVELFAAGSKKFETSGAGVEITGVTTSTKRIDIDAGGLNVTAGFSTFGGGGSYASGVSINGGVSIGATLNVAGVSTFGGNIDANGTLDVLNTSIFRNDVTFVGAGSSDAYWLKDSARFKLKDKVQLTFGSGQDFTIMHDGSHAYVDTNTGLFYSDATAHIIRNKAGTQDVAKFNEGASGCQLYNSNAVKLDTTGGGISVSGVTTANHYVADEVNITSGLESPYDQTGTGETIFVYDTRNDADGGAWRKNCQGTSWYNEGAGTYRGARKEFPAVAVIVLGQTRTTIYDGDDPTLPLWMQFRSSSGGYMLGCNDDYSSCVTALNGMLVIGSHNVYGGLQIIDFIKDTAKRIRGAITTNGTQGWWPTGIAGRNGSDDAGALWHNPDAGGRGYDNTDFGALKSDDVWSVAMKALKGAPIDPLTNLPIPTIAAAVDSGISIIKPEWHIGLDCSNTPSYQHNDVSGHVVDINSSNGSYTQGYSVEWTENDDLLFVMGDGNGDLAYIHTMQGHPHWDTTITIDQKSGTADNVRSMWRGAPSSSTTYSGLLSRGSNWTTSHNTHQHKVSQVVAKKGYEFAARTRNGLTHIYEDHSLTDGTNTKGNGMVAYATTAHATGWLIGKDKLCIMASTDDANITANRLEPNNSCTSGPGLTEANSTSGWTNNGMATFESSNTRAYHGSYSLHLTADTNGDFCHTTFTTVIGKFYTVSCKLYVTHDSFTIKVGTTAGSGNEHFESNAIGVQSYWQHFTGTFRATTTTTYFNITESSTSQDSDGWIDDVVFTEGVPDHTCTHGFAGAGGGNNFNRGAHIYGTITKSAVATGSDLVAYSGWGPNNFLYMPCYPNLNYGANDFSVYWWMNPNDSSSGRAIWSIDNRNSVADNAAASYVRCYFNGDDLRIDLSTAGYAYQALQKSLQTHPQDRAAWMQCFVIRRAQVMEIWINGRRELVKVLDSGMKGNSMMNELSELRIGQDSNTGAADNEIQLALFRSSATAPSPDIIRKMYKDELPLFQENAKCTLVTKSSGANDHIEAMSYDKRSDILYVGGKGGRADFRGLTRINNNTTEVTRGISGSNGLVVEY